MLELAGGVLLVMGLFSRAIAVPLVINLTAAYLLANREALFSVFSEPEKFYIADPYTFLFASVLVLIFGPGGISLDRLLESRREMAQAPGEASRATVGGVVST